MLWELKKGLPLHPAKHCIARQTKKKNKIDLGIDFIAE